MSDEQQGQPASGAAQQAASLSHEARVSDLTIGQLTAILRSEAGRVAAGGLAGAHANSGPPGFVNGGGHANFDPRVAQCRRRRRRRRRRLPGFVNGGGHANFDPRVARPGDVAGLARRARELRPTPASSMAEGTPISIRGARWRVASVRPVRKPARMRIRGRPVSSMAISIPAGTQLRAARLRQWRRARQFRPRVRPGGQFRDQRHPAGWPSLGLPANGPINMRIGGVQITR